MIFLCGKQHVAGVQADVADVEDEEGAGAAGRVEQPFVGQARSAVGRAAVELVEKLRGEPVGRVVFAEVVAQFLGHEVLVELLQQVAGAVGVGVERDKGVIGQLLHDTAQGGVHFGRPVVEIPAEEVAFEEVADAEVAENAAFLHRAEVVLQAGSVEADGVRQCDRLEMGDAGDLGAGVEVDDLDGEQLDERGVVAVDGKEQLEGLELVAGAGADSVKAGELLDIELGRVLLVAANLAEGAAPTGDRAR